MLPTSTLTARFDDSPHKESNKINIKRVVRQRDTTSPKLFTAVLESTFRRLNWKITGLMIHGEYFSHHHFADNIPICVNTPYELQHMQQELADESENQGLMIENDAPIYVNNSLI